MMESAPKRPSRGAVMRKSMQAPPPAPTPAPAPAQSKPASKESNNTQTPAASIDSTVGSGVDYTQIPKKLDQQFEALDTDAALRPTIIKPGTQWTHKSQKALLAATTTAALSTDQQKSKKNEAFDLLDGLTRAGALSCDDASLHVVIAATHCFDQDLMDTVVQRNMNPIEKVERSMLIMASTIHQASIEDMTTPEHYDRIKSATPELVDQLAIED